MRWTIRSKHKQSPVEHPPPDQTACSTRGATHNAAPRFVSWSLIDRTTLFRIPTLTSETSRTYRNFTNFCTAVSVFPPPFT